MNKNYNYSQTMMLKIQLSIPDNNGGSKIICNLNNALEIIKQVDNITCGCPKIIYLVGWQYDGHDDKYPAFFEYNEKLKRIEDKTAKDSFFWLVENAKKYNTIVSLHINVSDAYPDSPLWQEYLDNNLILLNRKGNPKITGVWNGKKAYQVRFSQEFSSGYFKKRVDKLIEIFPLKVVKVVHIDAFFVRNGKNTNISQEKIARQKMIEYFNSNGINVTSEFIYREHKSGFRAHFGKSDTIGLIPAFWNTVLSGKEIIKYQPDVLAGGMHCKSLTLDKSIEWLTYGNIQGEEDFVMKDWQSSFIEKFTTINVPYFYLNQFRRLKLQGFAKFRKLIFSNNVISKIKNKTIVCNNIAIKFNENLCIPATWLKNSWIVYNGNNIESKWTINAKYVRIYKVGSLGKQFVADVEINNGILNFPFLHKEMYLIEKIA